MIPEIQMSYQKNSKRVILHIYSERRIMEDNMNKGTAFAYPCIGEVVPEGYVKKVNEDGTIEFVPPETSGKEPEK
jgi:hypothetical protein